MIPPSPSALGVALALFGGVCLAVQAISVRLGTRSAASGDALSIVFLVNTVTFVGLALAVPEQSTVTPAGVSAFVAAGVFGTLIGMALYFAAIERVGASRSDTIKASQPLHASAIAAVVLGEPLGVPAVGGMLLVVGGIGLLVTDRPSGGSIAVDGRFAGVAAPLGAAVVFGIEPTVAKLGFGTGMGVFDGLAIKTVTALLGLALYHRIVHGRLRLPSPSRWFLLAGLLNAVALAAYYLALQVAPVAVVVPLVQTSPLLTVLLSRLTAPDLEPVTRRLVVASVCIVVGAGVVVAS